MKDPATLRTQAISCARARDTITQIARLIDTAINHAIDGGCPQRVKAFLVRAQHDMSTAQGDAETRRRRLLKKADAREQTNEQAS